MKSKSKKLYLIFIINYYLSSNNSHKISIIYTFNNINDNINGIDESSNLLYSDIYDESQFITYITNILSKKLFFLLKMPNKKYIFIHFDYSNSNKIGLIIPFIINKYYKNEDLQFILIVHIKRNFSLDNPKEIIYTLPDINYDIDQIFIDNLNGPDIRLNEIHIHPIQKIFERGLIDIKGEFNKTLERFTKEKLQIQKFSEIFEEYFNNDIKRQILQNIKLYINNNKDNFNNIIERIYKSKYINTNSVDIIMVVVEFIKREIIGEYMNKILFKFEEEIIYKIDELNMNFVRNINREENNKLKEMISSNVFNLLEDENKLFLIIITYDEKVAFRLLCKYTDKFINIEKEFYKEYPEYLENGGNFRVNDNLLDKKKTLKESKLKNNDKIIFKEFDKYNDEKQSDEFEDESENDGAESNNSGYESENED